MSIGNYPTVVNVKALLTVGVGGDGYIPQFLIFSLNYFTNLLVCNYR
jgi:hypothetical protein